MTVTPSDVGFAPRLPATVAFGAVLTYPCLHTASLVWTVLMVSRSATIAGCIDHGSRRTPKSGVKIHIVLGTTGTRMTRLNLLSFRIAIFAMLYKISIV